MADYTDDARRFVGFVDPALTERDAIRDDLGEKLGDSDHMSGDFLDAIADEISDMAGDGGEFDVEGSGDYNLDPDANMWRDSETGRFVRSGYQGGKDDDE